MKRTYIIAIVFLIQNICALTVSAQNKINYGSNNGKYLSVDGKKIYYEEYGKGTPLILLHGGFSTLNSFGSIIPVLAQHFRVIAMDSPGEGRSQQTDSLSFQGMATRVSKLIDQLKLDSAYVYGYSTGGIVAILLASERPDIVKMAIFHSSAIAMDGFVPQSAYFLSNVTPDIINANLKFWLDDHQKKAPAGDDWKKFVFDFKKLWAVPVLIPEDEVKKINIPVLIVQGDKDIILPMEGFKLHQLIPSSQLCILPNTTHFVLWERPDLIGKIVLDFLTRQKATGQFGM